MTARLDQGAKPDASGTITTRFHQSSVGGKVTVNQSAPGAYTFNLPVPTGSGTGSLAVSPMGGSGGRSFAGAECSIISTALVANGTVKQVKVSCRQAGAPGPTASPSTPA